MDLRPLSSSPQFQVSSFWRIYLMRLTQICKRCLTISETPTRPTSAFHTFRSLTFGLHLKFSEHHQMSNMADMSGGDWTRIGHGLGWAGWRVLDLISFAGWLWQLWQCRALHSVTQRYTDNCRSHSSPPTCVLPSLLYSTATVMYITSSRGSLLLHFGYSLKTHKFGTYI